MSTTQNIEELLEKPIEELSVQERREICAFAEDQFEGEEIADYIRAVRHSLEEDTTEGST